MARATPEQSEATAARIVATARSLFADRGFAAVGLEEVAAEAGVTRGAVYHHFHSKTGLFAAVHATAQRAVGDVIDRATADCGDPWQALEVGCRAFLEASVRDDVRRIMLVDAPAVLGWDVWRRLDAESSGRLLGEVLAELGTAGVIHVDSVSATQVLLSGAMNEAALWIASSREYPDALEAAWDSLRRMLGALRR